VFVIVSALTCSFSGIVPLTHTCRYCRSLLVTQFYWTFPHVLQVKNIGVRRSRHKARSV